MATILIVDDEQRIRELIREHLEFAGFTCREASDGSAALTVLGSEGADLVILDIARTPYPNPRDHAHRPRRGI